MEWVENIINSIYQTHSWMNDNDMISLALTLLHTHKIYHNYHEINLYYDYNKFIIIEEYNNDDSILFLY